MGRGHSPHGKRATLARERERFVFDLLRAGKSPVEISEQLPPHLACSDRHVRQIRQRVLEQLRRDTFEDAREVVAVEVARIDALIAVVWPMALEHDLLAIDRAIKLMKRRAELLGLDAPPKIAPTDANALDVLARLLAGHVEGAPG